MGTSWPPWHITNASVWPCKISWATPTFYQVTAVLSISICHLLLKAIGYATSVHNFQSIHDMHAAWLRQLLYYSKYMCSPLYACVIHGAYYRSTDDCNDPDFAGFCFFLFDAYLALLHPPPPPLEVCEVPTIQLTCAIHGITVLQTILSQSIWTHTCM